MIDKLKQKLEGSFEKIDGIYTDPSSVGYWSNLKKEDQPELINALETNSCWDVITEKYPQLRDIIFDPTRAVGIKLLDINPNDIGIDYGCMWGNLLVYAAKSCKAMVGIDKTRESLKFLQYRLRDEKINNCFLINCDLRKLRIFEDIFDFAIVNGVLEWIPEENEVELPRFLKKGKCRLKKPLRDPKLVGLEFLQMVYRSLKNGGKLYLAIENRYDYQYFLWKKDPHVELFYTAFLPRKVANIISNIWYGRPYVNYLYSHKELEELIKKAGFREVEKYASFPDYRFPMKIIPLKRNWRDSFEPVYRSRRTSNIIKRGFRKLRKYLDWLVYKKLKLFSLAPSFIVIARKRCGVVVREKRITCELLSSGTHNNNVAVYRCCSGKKCFYKKVAFSLCANQLIENEKNGYDWFFHVAKKPHKVILSRKYFYEIQIPEFVGTKYLRSAPIKGNERQIEMIIDYYKEKWLKAEQFAIHGDLALCNIIIDHKGDINIIDWEHFHFADKVYFGFDIVNMLFISFIYQCKSVKQIDKRTRDFLKDCYKDLIAGVPASNQILEKPFQNSGNYLRKNKHKFKLNVDIGEKFVLAKYPQMELERLDLLIT